MKSMLISLGHAFSHSPWFVHEPKYCSIVSTMFTTRSNRSGWPWGSRLRCATLAAVNSCAAPLGHAATHAPQPMHAAVDHVEHLEERHVGADPRRVDVVEAAGIVGPVLTPDPQLQVHL